MWVHKKEVQYHHVSSSESTSSKWTVITHSQKMAMKCSTWKTVLFLLAIVFVVQFTLQLRIAYLENSYTKSGGRGEPVFDFQKAFNLVIATTNKVSQTHEHHEAIKSVKRRSHKATSPQQETLIKPFIPPSPVCNITDATALSAINRAKSDECKDELRRVACAHQQKHLYFTNFTRSCPVPDNPAISGNMTYPKLHPDVPRVRILFMLTVHGRAVRQVHRVLKSIYHVNHFYYIHVDARSHYMHQELQDLLDRFDNVRLTPWRLATIWGGASLQQMLIRAMEDADTMTDWNWDFFVNLSESDFPFRNFTFIVEFLTAWRSHNFVRAHGKTSVRFIRKQGLDQTFYECEHHMWRIGPRSLPEGIHIDGGSDWFMLNREYIKYLVNSQDLVVLGLKHMYHYSLLPAESFFHTLLRNSRFCQTMVKNNFRLANWKRSLGCRCQYKSIVDWCGCSPNDFLAEDFAKIKGLNDKLFGRKFEAIINQEVINKLDFWLFGSYPAGTPGLDLYWENIYSANDFDESYSDLSFTVYRSMARLLRKRLSGCVSPTAPYEILDVYLLRESDSFAALLVTVRYGSESESSTFQLKMIHAIDFFKKVSVTSAPHFKHIEIGADFDKKEYVSRNYAGLQGLTSSALFVIRYDSGQAATISVEYITPSGQSLETHKVTLRGDWTIGEQALQWQNHQEPGIWTVKCRVGQEDVGSLQFAVYPQEVEKRKEISDEAGLQRTHLDIKYLPQAGGESIQARLQASVDAITGRAWTIGNICSVSPEPSCSDSVVACSTTRWSSFSPDPKSEFPPIKPDGRVR